MFSFVPVIIVTVRSAKHPPVGDPVRVCCRPHGIAGVSAVAVHRQLIVADLITDRERGIFSRVPQTRRTLNLLTDTAYTQRSTMHTLMRHIH